MPKLRELQVIGNPLDYPVRDIMKRGSKYLIRFLREKWKSEQNNSEIIIFNDEANVVNKLDKKILQQDSMKNKQIVIIYIPT